jgi:phosphoglycolate phosphatase
MLRKALGEIGVAPGDAIVVGDSQTDVDMARAAGVTVIVVSYGYTATPARELGADRVIDHLGEVPEAIAALSSNANGDRNS